MKTSKSHNNFPQQSWLVFQDAWRCWYCGMNTADSLHHIVGRGQGDSIAESSILNAAPLCNHKCHLAHHGKFRTDEWVQEFLHLTYYYLLSINYTFEENDHEFMKKYERFYNEKTPKS